MVCGYNQVMREELSREISFKSLRETHRGLYYLLAGTAWTILGFIFLLDLLMIVSLPHPGFRTYIVSSGSMEPTIPTGSLVISVPADTYKVDDIITFEVPGKGVFLHRIIYVADIDGETRFITQGDALRMPDPYPVPPDHVDGKVVVILPYLGYVALPGFFILLVLISLFLYRFFQKRNAARAARKQAERG
jgi:signal peptidase